MSGCVSTKHGSLTSACSARGDSGPRSSSMDSSRPPWNRPASWEDSSSKCRTRAHGTSSRRPPGPAVPPANHKHRASPVQ
ncbi:hypothetical protein D7X55_04405 [Corallococcus sp. AB049A]|nr:hypothetical protein D7X55_04405 [Corallococcus sp. AB049A]